jgi:trehalose 6-phosphate phosphatase
VVLTDDIAAAWRNARVSGVPPDELVLITDFDGTLADIVPDPTQAVALPAALAALRRLDELLADVIVLSARTNTQLERLVPIPGVRLVGDSGRALPRHAQKEALDHFNSGAFTLLTGIPGAWLEVKPASSAIHYRNTTLSGEEMQALINPLLNESRLGATPGRKVIEVHPRRAGKGSALGALLAADDPGGVVCFGDDENDRSMFEYVSSLDIPYLCVGVSSPEAPPNLFDRCELMVDGPAEAAALMNLIVEWASALSRLAGEGQGEGAPG